VRLSKVRLSTSARASDTLLGMTERTITVTIRGLRDAPDAGLSEPSTPATRLALVDTLTREAWALAGRALPVYPRHEAPVVVCPLRASTRPARG
jgi:hypothetical protein